MYVCDALQGVTRNECDNEGSNLRTLHECDMGEGRETKDGVTRSEDHATVTGK